MKASNAFKQTIQKYLEERAVSDPLFAVTYRKEKKNLDECVTYILNEVKKSGCNGFADEEIFGMAVHYYDEDNIKVGDKGINANVVVNHKVKLTEEEKAEANKKAVEKASKDMFKKMTTKKAKPAEKPQEANPTFVQTTLF